MLLVYLALCEANTKPSDVARILSEQTGLQFTRMDIYNRMKKLTEGQDGASGTKASTTDHNDQNYQTVNTKEDLNEIPTYDRGGPKDH